MAVSLRPVLALILAAASAAAGAAELGRLSVRSRLGQPLDAEVGVFALKAGEEKGLTARIGSRASYRSAGVDYNPALAGVSATLARRAGRPVVRLRSTRAIDEPTLELLVELRSSAGVYRRVYTVLLDPAGYKLPADASKSKPEPEQAQVPQKPEPPLPSSREALFGALPDPLGQPVGDKPKAPTAQPTSWRGFLLNTNAYDYREPKHWSRAVVRAQLGAQGGGGNLKWKATARVDADPVYAGGHFYPPAVRKDQKHDFFLRETYVDTSLGGLDLRIGKQNIVWGEMVGLFFADVVSARDQRDFILPDFEVIRIPQWALRAERFGDNTHAELVWLPFPDVDLIGKPGAEFYPFKAPPPTGFAQQFNDPVRPARNARNSNLGLRANMLRSGWDLAAFYYRSTDVNPTFYRDVVPGPVPTVVFTPRHDRIWQAGGTLGKDLGPAVAKAEVIYTEGRSFNVTRLTEPTGVVPQNTLDYVLGLDFSFGQSTRLNLQAFDRVFRRHDPDLIFDQHEGGVSLLLASKFGASLEPELLYIRSTNRSDSLVRAKLGWLPARNWRLTFGIDVFDGPVTGLFGRFAGNDRAYLETRYDF